MLLQSKAGGTDDSSRISVSDEHPEKINSPSMASLGGRVARRSDVQSEKAYDSKVVTDSGIIISFSDTQRLKALFSIVASFD